MRHGERESSLHLHNEFCRQQVELELRERQRARDEHQHARLSAQKRRDSGIARGEGSHAAEHRAEKLIALMHRN